MRLPQPFVESLWFQLHSFDELRQVYAGLPNAEASLIQDLAHVGLPPATSVEALAAMFGLNPGLLWSFRYHANRHYRRFTIPKGNTTREIVAPKVGLKIIQSWLGFHLSRQQFADHIFGFVPGRSHIDAAEKHIGADWAYSFDILNFFNSTPRHTVSAALVHIGYPLESAELICDLCTLEGRLVQGSPASPALSNLCFQQVDQSLRAIAEQGGFKLTRYADDVVFSGEGDFPAELENLAAQAVANSPWEIHPDKIEKQPIKGRIKIHGLLVKKDGIALTKGYRNKVRGLRHVYLNKRLSEADARRIGGHLNYARQVETRETALGGAEWENFDVNLRPGRSSNWLSKLVSGRSLAKALNRLRDQQ